jgi:murein DD-endopeptidase / murein LD-carboxypeptidase
MLDEDIAARARAMVGVRFRPQGRSPEHGLDCIGLVAKALALERVPDAYSLCGGGLNELESELGKAGLARVADAKMGDVLVMRAGAGQLHLGVWTGSGLVHADAGLRRVVERPGPSPWPVTGIWRTVAAEVL